MSNKVISSGFIPIALSSLALVVASACFYHLDRLEAQVSVGKVLVYDEGEIPHQVAPFARAGFDVNHVVQQAIDRAHAQGYVILRAGDDTAAPEVAEFRIGTFIAVPDVPEDAPQPKVPEELDAWLKSQVQVNPNP